MLQGKAIRQVLMQAVDTAHCAMFAQCYNNRDLAEAPTTTPHNQTGW